MLLYLALTNFKKHASLVVDFTKGLNGIYGPNYRGKSTILYGVLYALGGATQVPGTRLARRDSDGRFTVEMRWISNNEEYKAVRTKSTANLYAWDSNTPDGWALRATGTTAVNDEIDKIIGMSVKQWKELHFAKQKNAHSLLRYSANNLQQLMRRLVGAEELDQVQARLKRLADREDGVVASLGQSAFTAEECQDEIEKAERTVAEVKGALSAAETEVSELTAFETTGLAAIQKANERVIGLQEQKGTAETARVRLQAAERGLSDAKATLEEREADLATAQQAVTEAQAGYDADAGEKIAKFEGLKLRRAAAEQKLLQANQRHDKANEELRHSQQTVKNAQEARCAATSDSGDNVTGLIAELDDQVQEARQRDTLAGQKVKDLKAAVDGAECPTCHRAFEDHDPAKLQEELEQAMASQLAIAREVTDLSNRRKGLELLRKAVEEAATALTLANDKLKRAQATATDTEGDYNDAKEELYAVEGDENDLGLTEEIVTALRSQSHKMATLNQALAKAQSERGRAEAAVNTADTTLATLKAKGEPEDPEVLAQQISKVSAQLSKDRATLAEVREQLAGVRQRHQSAQSSMSAAVAALTSWTNRLEQLKKDSDRRATAEKRLAKIRHLQKHLKENAEGYMGKVWAGFLLQASQFVSQCTGGDIEALQRTDAGDFVFLEEGQEMQLEEASGAQEAIIGLAVQVSLSGASPCHLNTVLLDEPTADMDPDCSLATMVAMKALGVQVIFVSHHQTDNALCDNAITL